MLTHRKGMTMADLISILLCLFKGIEIVVPIAKKYPLRKEIPSEGGSRKQLTVVN